MLSSWGVSLSFFVLRAVLAVPNRKGFALTQNVNLTFCKLFEGVIVDDNVFAVLFHIFKDRNTFLCWFFLLLCELG